MGHNTTRADDGSVTFPIAAPGMVRRAPPAVHCLAPLEKLQQVAAALALLIAQLLHPVHAAIYQIMLLMLLCHCACPSVHVCAWLRRQASALPCCFWHDSSLACWSWPGECSEWPDRVLHQPLSC